MGVSNEGQLEWKGRWEVGREKPRVRPLASLEVGLKSKGEQLLPASQHCGRRKLGTVCVCVRTHFSLHTSSSPKQNTLQFAEQTTCYVWKSKYLSLLES